MKHSFYDVKKKEKVKRPVTEKVTYGKEGKLRYAFKAKTEDGRNLTAFVGKDLWESAKID
jgi:hypothetical protein